MPTEFASRGSLNKVISLINDGDIRSAETICREAIERQPKDVNMVALLGAILLKLGQHDESMTLLRRAIRLAPSFAKPHEDLGHLLLERGQHDEAATILRKATHLDPNLDNAFFDLGKALLLLGKDMEADEAFEASFSLNPQRRALAHAAEAHKQGRLDEAERLYREVLRENPDNVSALRLLGLVAITAGRFEDAEYLLGKAISLAPDFLKAIIDLGGVQQEHGRLEDAIDCFQRATEVAPNSAHAFFLLAAALAPAARTYDAVDAYQRAIELQPKHVGAWLGLGHVLKTVGRQQEAIDAYRQCTVIKPDGGESYWSLANLKTYSLTGDDIVEMQARVDSGGLTPQSEVNFIFALAKACEDRGDYDRAWSYYESGNAKRRMQERYDPVQTEVVHDSLVEVFDGELLRRMSGLGNTDPSPIFVVGLPRSGSTLIEQILASHSLVEGTSELPYLGRVASSLNRNRADGINFPHAVRELGEEHFKTLGREYLELADVHRVERKPRFVDKMPNNFPNIGFLKLILPNAKIIDARRHPLDACLSCYRQLFAVGQSFTYDLIEIGEYYLQYQRMMDHWHEVLPGQVLTVQYEENVTNIENQVRRILEFCELPWEDACIRFHETDRPIRTASSEQVRQPIYTSAINHSRHYRHHLTELSELLEPILERYEAYSSLVDP